MVRGARSCRKGKGISQDIIPQFEKQELVRQNAQEFWAESLCSSGLQRSYVTFGGNTLAPLYGPQFSVLDLSQMQDLQQLFLMLDLAENGLHLPTDLAELSLSQMKWKKFTIAGVESLHQLRISDMDRLADMDFSVFKSLDSLLLSHCPKLWELDITPLENMTGQLEIGFLENLYSLKAEGLQQLSGANLRYLPNLEQASRDNIEALTKTKIPF